MKKMQTISTSAQKFHQCTVKDKTREKADRKKFTIFLSNSYRNFNQCTVKGLKCNRQRGNADADIPFPLIKETRPLPLWDAEVIRTYFEEREASV